MNAAPFRPRWTIVGTVTSQTPLHVGDGGVVHRPALINEGKEIDVASVATDCDHRAYIPGTAIKGWLRRALDSVDPGVADVLLGSADGGGFRIACLDAPAAQAVPTFTEAPPHWHPTRLTGVLASVAIDRHLGTALDKHLAHVEYVPAGVAFDVTLVARDVDEWRTGATAEDAIAYVLAALDTADARSFNAEGLGASEANGWGLVHWELKDIKGFGREDLQGWLATPPTSRAVGYNVVNRAVADVQSLLNMAAGIGSKAGAAEHLAAEVTIAFDGLMLINGSQKAETSAWLRDERGRPWLPGRSLRGALRSQAERIVRTIAGTEAAACVPGHSCQAVKPYARRADHPFVGPGGICPICAVFGAAGWRSPFECSPFEALPDVVQTMTQHRVAVDRFSGGVPYDERPEHGFSKERFAGRKYKMEGLCRPAFRGVLRLDVNRLRKAEIWAPDGSAAVGLMALVLRDFAEHDIAIGMAAGTGYGTGSIEFRSWVSLPADVHSMTVPLDWPDSESEAALFLRASIDKLVALANRYRTESESERHAVS